METVLSLLLGIGLSAACGFRVFIPFLIVSIASLSGHLTLAKGFEWIGSYPALITFSTASLLEVAAYYVPWLDNLLDSVATPAAIVAGTIVTASVVSDMSPMMRWTLAIVAGGGAAALVQGTTVVARGVSTAATGGLANPVLATAELGGSIVTSLGAMLLPVVVGVGVVGVAGVVAWKFSGSAKRSAAPKPAVRV